MNASFKLAVLAGVAGLVSGCMTESLRSADGLTDGAGDAMAANTVMQMVDPWPHGVEDARLLVPAERAAAASSSDSGAGASQSKTVSNSSN